MSFVVIGLGEILWDLLPAGKQLGGAPANFACHARALGAEGGLVTRIGNDPLGGEILEHLQVLGLPTDCVTVDAAMPTGTVTVELSTDGQPCFTIHEPAAWDRLTMTEAARAAGARTDAVCFGTLGQRAETARSTIRSLICRAPAKALRVFDLNLRQHLV
jgi:fructokinase